MANPIVYLGQCAVQIGIETDRLCKKENLAQSPSVYADTRACYGRVSQSINVMDVNMPHLFSYPSDNSPTVERIVHSILHKLEQCDNPSGVGIVADLCSGTGSSLSSAVISEIKDLAPHLRLNSVFTLPPDDTMQGINVLNGIMTAQMSLEYCDSVMLRSVDDALALVKEKKNKDLITLQDSHMAIAADLYCALGPKRVHIDMVGDNFDYNIFSSTVLDYTSVLPPDSSAGALYCWPAGVCSADNKLCDVRSSLWRLHELHEKLSVKKSISGRGASGNTMTNDNYSPIRALAANLHALHTTTELYNISNDCHLPSDFTSPVVHSASLGYMTSEPVLHCGRDMHTVNSSGYGAGSRNHNTFTAQNQMVLSLGSDHTSTISPSEVASLLHWACPSATFPLHLGRHSYRDCHSGQTVKLGKSRKVVGATNKLSNNTTVDTSMSSLQMSMSTNNSSASGGSRIGDHSKGQQQTHDIVALSFASPYARKSLTRICSRAQVLYDKNAYVTRYSDVGVDKQDFEQCLNYVSDVLLNSV